MSVSHTFGIEFDRRRCSLRDRAIRILRSRASDRARALGGRRGAVPQRSARSAVSSATAMTSSGGVGGELGPGVVAVVDDGRWSAVRAQGPKQAGWPSYRDVMTLITAGGVFSSAGLQTLTPDSWCRDWGRRSSVG